VNQDNLFQVVLQIADDHLILGHRVSEWCGHAPILEEDLSLPNMALDLIGQARQLYAYAGELEGKGRKEDDLAYLRTDREYRNCLLVERPNGDFAHTMLRQTYFAAFMREFWQRTLTSPDKILAGVAARAVKEIAYHFRHSAEWVIRLGDGTEPWNASIQIVFDRAGLEMPVINHPQLGGRQGRHTEDFGFLLADLQYLQRTFPGVSW